MHMNVMNVMNDGRLQRPGVFMAFMALMALMALVPGMRIGAQPLPPADLVLTNGKVITLEQPAEAEAIAARGGRIVAIGTSTAVSAHVGPDTRVIDLGGQLVIPGFVESHGHFPGVGEAQLQLKLMDASSWDEIVAMVEAAAKAARPGAWIYGRGWHQEKWTSKPGPGVEGFPSHHALSRVSPDNPVLLTHASGHASFANAKAMAVSGITAATPDPPGGDILKDDSGQPIGVFRETAAGLIRRGAGEPPPTPAERSARARRALELASAEVLAKGVTSFHDAGSSFADVDLMKELIDAGRIRNRLYIMLREPNAALAGSLAKYRTVDHAGGFLTVRAIKRSIDGALGSRGAWLLEPYADHPETAGHNTTTVEEIRETARLALQHGYQLAVHAIGDRANRETLDLFEEMFRGRDGRALRWRIEHAQHLHPADIPRFGALGVIASMQGIHCTSDAPYVVRRLGPARAAGGAYVWQKLLRSGAVVTNGTDAPVEDVDPVASFSASVSRRTADGTRFYPDQRMSRLEALRSYTIAGAYAAFEEDSRGSLKVGKYADLVALSKDILTVPEEEIPDAEVVLTVVGGAVVYEKQKAEAGRER